MTPEEAAPVLRQKIQEAKDRGLMLETGRLQVRGGDNKLLAVCALGAYLMDSEDITLSYRYSVIAAIELGTHEANIAHLINGWDEPNGSQPNPWGQLGRSLHIEFGPIVHNSRVPIT